MEGDESTFDILTSVIKNLLGSVEALARQSHFYPLFSRLTKAAKYSKVYLRLYGAKPINIDEAGNTILRLNYNSKLGSRGDYLHVPRDRAIFLEVMFYGQWEPHVSDWIASKLLDCEKYSDTESSEILFLDIGSNSGLISRQVDLASHQKFQIILVEPLFINMEAAKKNMILAKDSERCRFVESAISRTTGSADIFTEFSNMGNTSLDLEAVPANDHAITEITTISVSDFFENYLSEFETIVLKIDTQGFDAIILSAFSAANWGKFQHAVIEVWASNDPPVMEIETVLECLSAFELLTWDGLGQSTITLEEVRSYWLSREGRTRNLFVSRNCS